MRLKLIAPLITLTFGLIVFAVMVASPALADHEPWHTREALDNPYDPDSIHNPYGRYGSPYSPDSLSNPYGRLGNPYSPESPHNPYGPYGNPYSPESLTNPYSPYYDPNFKPRP